MINNILEVKEQEDLENLPKHISLFKIFKQMLKIVVLALWCILSVWILYLLITGKFLDYVKPINQVFDSLGL